MKKIMFTNPDDGSCTIIVPSPNAAKAFERAHPDYEGEPTEQEVAAWVLQRSLPEGVTDAVEVDDADIPTDRIFRNAWVKGAGKVDVDMPKARDIVREEVRRVRKPELEKLDADYMLADEQGDTTAKQAIATQKQVLRDAPADPAIENAATPEALKAVRPGGLDWTQV